MQRRQIATVLVGSLTIFGLSGCGKSTATPALETNLRAAMLVDAEQNKMSLTAYLGVKKGQEVAIPVLLDGANFPRFNGASVQQNIRCGVD